MFEPNIFELELLLPPFYIVKECLNKYVPNNVCWLFSAELVTILEAAAAAEGGAESHGAHGIRHITWKTDEATATVIQSPSMH